MLFSVRLSNFTGTTHFTEVEDTLSIRDLKEFLARYLYNCESVSIFKNCREITIGTIESNGICPDDTLHVVCKMKTGFDQNLANEIKLFYKQFDENYTKLNEKRDELENILSETEKNTLTPLEILSNIQMERKITVDDCEKEDMRILFQRCRDQIEDESKKMQQTKKENNRTKEKLEALKNKLSQKKKKGIHKSFEINKTFGGFKKGFLLK